MEHVPAFNYDASSVPAGFDRARDHGPAVLALWMRTVERLARRAGDVSAILDLGCGTGRFTAGLADHFGAHVIGLDPSRKMLQQARSKPVNERVRYVSGSAEALPLADGSVDLVFASMVFHHFRDPARAATECRRVLRPGGTVFLRAGTLDRSMTYPFVPFFPESVPFLESILPPCTATRAAFESAGFRTAVHEIVVQQIADTHAAYADKLEAGGDSVLARLDPSDFAAGLARLRAHAANVDPQPVTEDIDVLVFV